MLCNLVKKEIESLIDFYNLEVNICTDIEVKLSTNSVVIKFLYDKYRSSELSCYLGEKNLSEEFNIQSILRYKKIKNYQSNHSCQATNDNDKIYCIKNYVYIIENYCQDFFEENSYEYEKLKIFLIKESMKKNNDKKIKHIRDQMKLAWQLKKYDLYISLSKQILSELSESELKKYELSYKYLNNKGEK